MITREIARAFREEYNTVASIHKEILGDKYKPLKMIVLNKVFPTACILVHYGTIILQYRDNQMHRIVLTSNELMDTVKALLPHDWVIAYYIRDLTNTPTKTKQ